LSNLTTKTKLQKDFYTRLAPAKLGAGDIVSCEFTPNRESAPAR